MLYKYIYITISFRFDGIGLADGTTTQSLNPFRLDHPTGDRGRGRPQGSSRTPGATLVGDGADHPRAANQVVGPRDLAAPWPSEAGSEWRARPCSSKFGDAIWRAPHRNSKKKAVLLLKKASS